MFELHVNGSYSADVGSDSCPGPHVEAPSLTPVCPRPALSLWSTLRGVAVPPCPVVQPLEPGQDPGSLPTTCHWPPAADNCDVSIKCPALEIAVLPSLVGAVRSAVDLEQHSSELGVH